MEIFRTHACFFAVIAVINSRHAHALSPITISQYLQDIHTRMEASIDPPQPVKPSFVLANRIPRATCSRCGHLLSSVAITSQKKQPVSRHPLDFSSFPTVPKCANEYLYYNVNCNEQDRR